MSGWSYACRIRPAAAGLQPAAAIPRGSHAFQTKWFFSEVRTRILQAAGFNVWLCAQRPRMRYDLSMIREGRSPQGTNLTREISPNRFNLQKEHDNSFKEHVRPTSQRMLV